MPGVACKGVGSVEVFKPAVSLAVALETELEIDAAASLLLLFRMERGYVPWAPIDAEHGDLGCDDFVALLLGTCLVSTVALLSSLNTAFSASSSATWVTSHSCSVGRKWVTFNDVSKQACFCCLVSGG